MVPEEALCSAAVSLCIIDGVSLEWILLVTGKR